VMSILSAVFSLDWRSSGFRASYRLFDFIFASEGGMSKQATCHIASLRGGSSYNANTQMEMNGIA
jgi:hypothetical protein